jgi:hypothetical protein
MLAGALEALVDHLTGDLLGSSRDLVPGVELYVAVARDPVTAHAPTAWWPGLPSPDVPLGR